MSFANRQVILHRIREVFSEVLGNSPEEMGMHVVYDVAHNTAKLESHIVDGKERSLLVHRKGATRAFGPQMQDVPEKYKDMWSAGDCWWRYRTSSYLLVGCYPLAIGFL